MSKEDKSKLDGAVTGPSSAVSGRVAVFNGTTGKVIKDSGFTIAKSVPADAKFTDTTYGLATTSANGLMSKEDKAKMNDFLDEISVGLHQGSRGFKDGEFFMTLGVNLQAWTLGNEEVLVENAGMIDLLFDNVTSGGPGMMTPELYNKLNGIATGATADSALSNSEIDAAIAAAG